MPMEFLLMPVFLIVGAVIGYVFRRFTSEKLLKMLLKRLKLRKKKN